MKKALFIVQSYPSNKSANVLCDEKIMNVMRYSGKWEIHILAYRFHGESLYDNLNGFHVHRFQKGWWWTLYTYARDHEQQLFFKFIMKLDRLRLRLSQAIFIPIYPNTEPFLDRKIGKEAIKLHKKETFHLVVSEHHGRDTLYGGHLLKKTFPDIKFCALLWDPISGKTLAKYLPKKYAEKKILEDEDKLLGNADLIIMLNSSKQYQLSHSQNKPFFSRVRFLDIPGLIKQRFVAEKNKYASQGKINIIYTGLISYPDRDPSLFLQILASSKHMSDYNILFFSIGNGTEHTRVMIKKLGIKGSVFPFISRDELNSVMNSCDIFLNIGGPNSTMVPSKIFEYMSYGKPIISTFYVDCETSKNYFEKYPLALCLDLREPIDENSKKLDAFIDTKLGKTVPFEKVAECFPLNNPQVFVDEIEKLFTI